MSDPTIRPTYRLVLQAQPNEVPPAVRLRRALKHLLRWFGLQVMKIEEIPPNVEVRPQGSHGEPGQR
jgi:hypothetical protein